MKASTRERCLARSEEFRVAEMRQVEQARSGGARSNVFAVCAGRKSDTVAPAVPYRFAFLPGRSHSELFPSSRRQ